MPRKPLSIATFTVVILAAMTALVLGVVGVIGFRAYSDRQRSELRSAHAILANQLASSLALPIWNFDRPQIDKVIEAAMQDRNVHAVVVHLADLNSTVHARVRDANGQVATSRGEVSSEGLLSEARDIETGGDVTGNVVVLVTPRFVEDDLRRALTTIVGTVAVLMAVLFFGLYGLLWLTVLHPLAVVESLAASVSSAGGGSEVFHGRHFRGELESLRASLVRMLELLERRYADLQRSEENLRRSEGTLTDVTESRAVAERLVEIERESKRALERSAAELAATNVRLDAANRELEAFSYSVSHDLRAPLRHIDGFGAALEEEYGASLPPEARKHLATIRTATQRMGRLIDDLLNLARVARAELRETDVDLSALCREISMDLARSNPARSVRWTIAPGVSARGDQALLRIALTNLLDNAWKYTSRRPEAHIEFGTSTAAGALSCFVRDDGAGFDMQYAGRIFGAFQRLHPASDFEGTGIGLATVQRIVVRHGGRIDAEAMPGAGATFRFVLPSLRLDERAATP